MNHQKLFLSKEELFNLYVAQKQTAHTIAQTFGVNDSTVIYHLKKHNIQIRNKQFEFETNSQIKLTDLQQKVLIGTVLGDGCLQQTKSNRLANLITTHGPRQESYIRHKADVFGIGRVSRFKCLNRQVNKEYEYLSFRSKATTDFLTFYCLFYPNRQKRVPNNISNLLTSPISLAYWIMDDGCLNKYDRRLTICTDCFTHEEHVLLSNALMHNFNLNAKICRYGKHLRLRFGQKDSRLISRLIESFVIDSMKYKLVTNLLPKSTNITI